MLEKRGPIIIIDGPRIDSSIFKKLVEEYLALIGQKTQQAERRLDGSQRKGLQRDVIHGLPPRWLGRAGARGGQGHIGVTFEFGGIFKLKTRLLSVLSCEWQMAHFVKTQYSARGGVRLKASWCHGFTEL